MLSGPPNEVRKFKLVTPSWGWMLKDTRVLSSDLWGKHVADITPPLSAGQCIASVFFLDPAHGWSVLHRIDVDSDGRAEVVVSATTDGGRSWTASAVIAAVDNSVFLNYGG